MNPWRSSLKESFNNCPPPVNFLGSGWPLKERMSSRKLPWLRRRTDRSELAPKWSAAKSGPSGISRDSKAEDCRPRRDISHVSTKGSRLTLALESASRQIALSSECESPPPPINVRDNSRSGRLSENDRITC